MNWFSKIHELAGQEYERYLPTAFDESLTLLEKVNKVIETLNQIVSGVNTVADFVDGQVNTQNEKIKQLRDDFEILKDWLENEGLQERTVWVLNEWFDSGRLAQIINNDVFDMKTDKVTFEQFVLSTTEQLQLIQGTKADKTTFEQFVLSTTEQLQQTVEQVNSTVINVKYPPNPLVGAKGDGTTNDSQSIQAIHDYLVSIGGGILYFPTGTYLVNLVIDSNVTIQGTGLKTSILKSPNISNKDVIKGKNFDTLTGSSKQTPESRGVRYVSISNILIDGNKQNNIDGYGIRLWGSSLNFDNVIVQNCVKDGIYTEFTTHDSPIGLLDPSTEALESFFNGIKTLNNGGNGWTFKGPHDASIMNFITFGNGGWGLYQEKGSINGFLWNSWLNTIGSFYIQDALDCYKMQATGPYAGIGIDIQSNVGNVKLTDVYVSGHETGLILRGSNCSVSGVFIGNRDPDYTKGDAIVIDGAVNFKLDVNGSDNFNCFSCISGNGENRIEGNFIISTKGTLTSGDIYSVGSYVNVMGSNSTKNEYLYKLPSKEIYVGGYKPKLPTSNGTILTDDTLPIPTNTKRGVVLMIDAPTNLTEPPTATDFNNLVQLLKYSGVLG